ncbi:hypothetical protein N0392_01980 [Morganella morganii]|uniref:Uncharacterized protein n=1 Tax=Morganella morganii TaxID=582 RepID=A0A9Q4GQN9_MORMO|nr:hypothetical protein [Morganella morganii]MCY0788457.1 hypothetical protein [Morganella morganii]
MTATQQQQIFHQPLEVAEQKAVTGLVKQHKANAALTQQLALDASKLISSSQERLQDQSNSGFFKRFWGAISGKNNENQLINQSDTLQMQRFAWHYLMQLQQQNLINSQSIAIIRNNLGTMNEYIIETRDFLEQAIDKINRRLVHVENNTRFNNWSLDIEANKRRYKSYPDTILVLSLAYDFMRRHQDAELVTADINYLIVTLEKLGVNCDEEVRLLDFILELIDQIDIIGIDRYRSTIELSVDDYEIDSHFIQTNISGIGFNSLYFLSEQYEKIVSLIDDDVLCNSDEAREKLISRLFGEEFSGLSTTYSIRNLISEVIGGSLVTIDIYRDINGLNATVLNDTLDYATDTLTLVSALPDICQHSFLDATDSEEKKSLYLLLLALGVENSTALTKQGHEFLTLLGEYASCPAVIDDIFRLADSPYKYQEYQHAMLELLGDDNTRYTWLFDVFFLLILCGKKIENPQIMNILSTLKPTQFKETFPHMLTLLQEQDEAKLLNSAAKLTSLTQGWVNIFRYRELRFKNQFSEEIKQLSTVNFACTMLNFDMLKLTMKFSEYSFFMGGFDDGSLLSKMGSAVGSTAFSLGRKSSLSDLNGLRKKAREFLSSNASALSNANGITSRWGLPTFEYDNQISYSDYELDNSAENEDWHDQISNYQAQIDDSLTAFSSACSDAAEQLELFAEGEFGKSVIHIKEQKHIELLQQKKLEKLDKQSVTVMKDGKEQRLRIEWQDIENPPCDPEKISHIKTDGKVWFIIDDDTNFYRSEDRLNWHTVIPDPSEKIRYVNKIMVLGDIWVLFSGSDSGFYYSSDALTWQQSQFPDVPNTWDFRMTEDLVYFNNLWLWRFTERKEYQYKEDGFFFDSTKTSTYDKSIFFSASSLDAKWHHYEETPNFSEGVEIQRLCSLPGINCLLAFCKYSWSYLSAKKRPESEPTIEYHVPGKSWRTCTWNNKKEFYNDIIVTRMNGSLMCFYSGCLLTSDKGYEWKRHEDELYVADCFHLTEISLFTSSYNCQVIYLSNDGVDFKELMLDEGSWNYLAANKQGLLSVYSPNSHETFLRLGTYTYLFG